MNITLDSDHLDSLRALAETEGRSVEAIVRDAVDDYLRRRREWQQAVVALDAAVDAIRSRIPPGISPEEIERDITEASEEYWATQRAARDR